jgi:multidrug efflux pump subunit AcrA (membrane-fusion protein)
MYVNVAFATIGGAESTSPVIPAAAVQNVNNQQVVFVATGNPNVFVMRPVQLGPQSGGSYAVVGGLTVGERVAAEPPKTVG